MNRAVFLDRDGVLNRVVDRAGEPGSPRSLVEVEIAEDVPTALRRLVEAGFVLLGITNQPEIARRQTTASMVEAVNALLLSRLPVREMFVCPHEDADQCDCRKPKPGLLLRAAAKYDIDLSASFMVGDRWRDIGAGIAAGCRTVLLEQGWSKGGQANFTATSLTEAADWILAQERAR